MNRLVKIIRGSIVIKTVITIVVLLAGFTVIVCALGYSEVTKALLDQYAKGAFRTASIAAHVVNPNKVQEYANSGGEGEEYEEAYNRLSQICNASGATFVYVIIPDQSDYKTIRFIFSTMNQNVKYSRYDFGYVRDTTNEEYERKYKLMCEENSAGELVVRDQGYIETDPHITAMMPLIDTSGTTQAIMCVQLQMDVLIEVRNSFVRKVLLIMVCAALAIIIVLSLSLNHSILQPVRIISAEASRFARENIKTGDKLTSKIRKNDDIGQLAGSIDQMETQIQSYVANLTHVTAEKERISTELTLASRIQSDMLPNIFPAFPGRNDFDIFASMDPAREIGGDFYNFFLIDESHLCVFIADVSGKGVPAALFMMASMIVLTDNAMMGRSPSEILESANEAICATNREEMFVTVWLGILDLETGMMTAANAGHEYPVIKHPGGNYELIKDVHGFVIGGMAGVKYRNYEIKMEPGTRLFVYTDGVAEATDSSNTLFGTKRMLDALNADREADPMSMLANVTRAVDEFVGDEEQFDDITMLGLEYKGQQGK